MARLLLDENLPRRLAAALAGHPMRTVGQMRWNGIRDGRLLDLAEAEFDILVTTDEGMRFQQSMTGRAPALIVLRARSNRFADLEPLVPDILRTIGCDPIGGGDQGRRASNGQPDGLMLA